MNNEREYRNMTFEVRKDGDEPSFLVEGYASTFERYKLLEIDGEDYNEQIMPEAFDVSFFISARYRTSAKTARLSMPQRQRKVPLKTGRRIRNSL